MSAAPPRTVTIVADGRDLSVPPDVTVAAALLSVGVRAFRTSVRGEPRAPLCGMGVCHECRVTIDGVGQRRACLVAVRDGMDVVTTGSGEWGAGNRRPGHASRPGDSPLPTPHSRFDVAIIGAGPAGIAAATRAAESGRRVVLVDESPDVGGQIWRHRGRSALPREARRWMSRLERSGATVLRGTSVVDVRDAGDAGGFLVVGERADGASCVVRAGAVVLATGARERWVPFPGWTLPGVYGVGGAQALHKAGLSFAGKRVVIAGSGPLLLPVAASLAADGARVLLVAEQAPRGTIARFALGLWRRPATLLQAVRYRAAFLRTAYSAGTWVTAARGDGRVEEVDVTDGRTTRTIACDALCVAHGLVPATELARLLGCATARGAVTVDDRQRTSRDGVYCAGEGTGVGGAELAVVEGEIAGLCAAGREEESRPLRARRDRLRATAAAMERAFAPRDELRALTSPDTIVCRCEDVPAGALRSEWTVRQAKLYTRAGMGPCQGRVCGAALQFLYGWPDDAVRLPSEPALLATLLHADADDDAHDAVAAPHDRRVQGV